MSNNFIIIMQMIWHNRHDSDMYHGILLTVLDGKLISIVLFQKFIIYAFLMILEKYILT